MRTVVVVLFIFFVTKILSQPILVNSGPFAQEVSTVAYDSINNKIFYNISQGCNIWNIPCTMSYTASLNNLMNKYDFADNNLTSYLNSNFMVDPPSHPVSNYNASISRQTVYKKDGIYTNFGYYFNKIDTTNLSTIWSYTTNTGLKEVSTFEIKSDSVFLFQRDSSSTKNYYTLIVKNKLTGSTIIYNSLQATNPINSLGAIEGHINNSTIINNSIILSGVFSASISGTFVARNLVSLNLLTGQIQVPPLTFQANTAIYDLKYKNNKIYLAGKFSSINGFTRKNFAVLDNNLNLLNDTVQFAGIAPSSGVWLDNIVFYDNYLIAKGNFNQVDNTVISPSNSYSIRVINTANNTVLPWTINLPPGSLTNDGYTFQMVKNKLYLKKRGNFSQFYIYCFEPITYSPNIIFPGSLSVNPSPSVAICSPDNGNANIFTAPIKYVSSYNWVFSGSNATIVPIGNGSNAKLITGTNSTNGILSVVGINDCGLSTPAATLNIIVKQKPLFNLPASPQIIICNPDSTLLQTTTTNTNSTIWWRKNLTTTTISQPFYAKTPGNYYTVIIDNVNGCKDSGFVSVNSFKVKPNSKLTSHFYPGVSIPIDTVTCLKPFVNITASSDTSGVSITWKSIATNSVFPNPLSISVQNNLKVNVSLNNSSLVLNCSYYTASLNAVFSPSNCSALWSGPLSYTATNPSTTNNPGKYYVSINNPVNGCTKLDSVSVITNTHLMLKSSNDTIVCKLSPLNLNSIRIGTLSGVTYSWSTGNVGTSINVSPSATTNYVINANGPGGCIGTDTIKVIIPANIKDSTVTYRSCDNSQTGTVVMFAKGGIPPYKYSINNGTSFFSTNTFTNIPFGNYNLAIKDSIGCIETTSVSVNNLSSLPVPIFLASTRNFKSDTIVLVDISIPKADSVQWLLPIHANIIGGGMFDPIIAVNDTGQFTVTMKAFYGNCIINVGKLIKFATKDSLHANYYNANGIKTILLFPNPNTGQFTVSIEFYKKQNASIQVWDTSPYKQLQQNYYEVDNISLPVDLSQLQNGSYILRVIGEFDAGNKSFIISK